MLDEVRCNRCFVREHGRNALGWKLIRFFRRVIGELFSQTQEQLDWAWYSSSNTCRTIPKQHIKELQEIAQKSYHGVFERRDRYERRRGIACMKHSYVANLTMLHEEFKTLWTAMRTHADFVEEAFLENAYFMAWLDCYHESEAIWKWLRKVIDEVESNPDMLVAWALGRDGASLT